MRFSALSLSISTALTLAFGASAVRADLAAADVWGDWNDYLVGMGYTVTATEIVTGNVLTVEDVQMTVQMQDAAAGVTMRLGTITFTENGDGTVSVGIPESMPITMTTTPETGEKVTFSIDYTQSGFVMTASGTPAQMRYGYSAQTITMTLDGLVVDDVPVPASDASGAIAITGITGTSAMDIGALRTYDQTMQAASITYDLAFKDPENGGNAKITGASQNLDFSGKGQIPLSINQTTDMSAMLDAGFAFDGVFTYVAGGMKIEANGPDGPFNATTSSQGGRLGVAMSKGGMSYEVNQSGLKVDAAAATAPLPIAFAVANSTLNLTMPLKKSDEPNDFAFGFSLGDFTMSDMLWGIFDPTAQLPRDPATLALDLTGKARLLFDFLDPSAVAVSGDPSITPAEVESLNINKLQVIVAGAELTGAGAFTFDNTQSFNGMPKPTGAVDLKLVGGNKLLDKLVGMGLVSLEQANGARMMMGLFGVPGTDPDTLTSKIEVNEEGHVLANGQRVQ